MKAPSRWTREACCRRLRRPPPDASTSGSTAGPGPYCRSSSTARGELACGGLTSAVGRERPLDVAPGKPRRGFCPLPWGVWRTVAYRGGYLRGLPAAQRVGPTVSKWWSTWAQRPPCAMARAPCTPAVRRSAAAAAAMPLRMAPAGRLCGSSRPRWACSSGRRACCWHTRVGCVGPGEFGLGPGPADCRRSLVVCRVRNAALCRARLRRVPGRLN